MRFSLINRFIQKELIFFVFLIMGFLFMPLAFAEQECTDSDGGENYYIKGIAVGESIFEEGIVTKTDYCKGDNLIEYYCNPNGVESIEHYCPHGCSNGTCLETDLIIEDVNLTEQIGSDGIPYYWLVGYVKNVGNTPANKSRIKLTIEPGQPQIIDEGMPKECYKLLSSTTMPIPMNDLVSEDILEPGRRERFTVSFDVFESGDVKITVEADYDKKIDELDENNNIFSKKYHIITTLYKAGRVKCEGEPEDIIIKQIAAEVCNNDGVCDEDSGETVEKCPNDCKLEICKEGDEKDFICLDGTKVSWCSCLDEKWQCVSEPQTQCHEIKEEKEGCVGCLLDEECEPYGYRTKMEDLGVYCSKNKKFAAQKDNYEPCSNHYECVSNLCIQDECVSMNLLQRIIEWVKKIFK